MADNVFSITDEFPPEAAGVMGAACDDACRRLALGDDGNARREVALIIIEGARKGLRDRAALCGYAVRSLSAGAADITCR